MSNESNLEFMGGLNPKKLTSLEEDFKREQAETLADQVHWKKYGTNRRNGARKHEIMKELSRERFPWEG